MLPLDDRTTCYTLIFWYFETADPTRPAGRPDPCTTLIYSLFVGYTMNDYDVCCNRRVDRERCSECSNRVIVI